METGSPCKPAHAVGLEEEVEHFEKIALQYAERVKIVGIVGASGCGKTTLAREIYKRKSSLFQGSCFLYGVRDAASKIGLHRLQEELLEVGDVKHLTVPNISEGKELLARHLKHRRLLIVLDDVDGMDQIKALLPPTNSLGYGSLIIVTTCYIGLLKSPSMPLIAAYRMGGLNQSHAQQLFCWHAFGQPSPLHGFQDLVELLSSSCEGMPLSLQTLGQQLHGKPKDYWETELVRISTILFKEIKQSDKVLVIKGDECSNKTENLLLLRWYDCPHTSIPPWISIKNLIVLDLRNGFFNKLWSSNLPLQLRKINILGSVSKLPKSIGQLQNLERIIVDGWLNTSLKSLPEEFCHLKSLKHLALRWCRALAWLPERFGNLTNLQHLDLAFCSRLNALPQSFKELVQLQYLDLQSCRNLEIQPQFLGQITTLQHINFKHCGELRILPAQVPYQVYLKNLNLIGTSLKVVPDEIGRLVHLEVLEIGSPYLTGLPVSLANNTNLRTLSIEGCSSLKSLPDSLLLLKNLTINSPQELKKTLDEGNRRGKRLILKKKVRWHSNYIEKALSNF